jgi:TolB-like protein/Flp pilus assembly protein TadD
MMKFCPECRREYDNTMMFCLDDGAELLYGPAMSVSRVAPGIGRTDEEATAIFSPIGIVSSISPDERTQVFERGTQDASSIAVLPFTNISADPDNEYFCDGLAEELLNALAKVDGLKVAARTSTFSFRGKDVDVGTIGRALGVQNVLEGSVRRSGDKLRITVQLIKAADGYHIWSERYDREMQDVFDIQDEITLSVVDALKLKLLGDAARVALKRHTENTEAYKAYLLGRYLRHTKNDVGGARRAFEEAVRLDPSHAPSWVGFAEGTILAAHYALIPARAACEDAKKALATAKALDNESAEGLYVEGFIAYVEGNWKFSEQAYRRAIERNPKQVHAMGSFALTLSVQGRFDEARSYYEQARLADPLAAFPYAITGAGLVIERRFDESLQFFEQAFTFEKENTLALWGYAIANASLERFADGISAAREAVRVSRRAAFFLGLLGWCLAKDGRPAEARTIIDELRERPADAPTAVSEAWLLGELGDVDAAFELLFKAKDEPQAFAYYTGLPTLDRLRDDPRLIELMQSAGLVPR